MQDQAIPSRREAVVLYLYTYSVKGAIVVNFLAELCVLKFEKNSPRHEL